MSNGFRIKQMVLTAEQLLSLPDKERKFLLLFAHVLNDTNFATKLVVISMQFDRAERLRTQTSTAQGISLIRLVIGRLFEAYEVVKTQYNPTLAKVYNSLIGRDSSDALSALKRYFGSANVIFQIRNHFSFHYSLKHGMLEIPADAPDSELVTFLHQHPGNCLYYFAEYALSKAFADVSAHFFQGLEKSDPGTYVSATGEVEYDVVLNRVMDEVKNVGEWVNTFGEGVIVAILERNIGFEALQKATSDLEIHDVARLNDLSLPFFIEFDA